MVVGIVAFPFDARIQTDHRAGFQSPDGSRARSNAEAAADLDGIPPWIDLPAMMKMRISTPHYSIWSK
jgi:hypothetical protein